ncbi:tautomerase family protein [Microbacterium gilvum]|uniref:4-oxalocrotonate tautomerase n=1 Tax=Microbacterium gilvum TaxID=1336204 RepID=A0ABP8ZUJ7_9MICO
MCSCPLSASIPWFAAPPGRSQDFIRIEFTIFPGRSSQAKRALYREVTVRLEELGIAPDDVFIIVHEPPLENWGIAGRSASEIDLGFALDV